MGSSSASATCLHAILRLPGMQVVGVVTQPDRPAGRYRKLTPCPCRAYAAERNITEFITPENVNSPESLETLRRWKPDIIVVVAFGQFLRREVLELPPHGCINCHYSLLPRYRGASPVNAAIAAGDKLSGVSVIRMGEGMDDGPILRQSVEPIYPEDNTESLMDRLAILGGVTLGKTLQLIDAGRLPPPVPQIPEEATFAHKLKKTDGCVDWASTSLAIERRLRAFQPWPGSYTFLPQRFRKQNSAGRLVIGSIEFIPEADMKPEWRSELPGTVLSAEGRGPVVRTADTALRLTALQPEGGRMLSGSDFLRGRQLKPLSDMLG